MGKFKVSLVIVAVERDTKILRQLESLLENIEYVEKFSVIPFLKYNKRKVKAKLISLCDKNEEDIIILAGNITTFSTLSNDALEMIGKITDNVKNMSVAAPLLVKAIAVLTAKLSTLFNQPICGRRQRKLIISMCGSYARLALALKENETMILYTCNRCTTEGKSDTDTNDIMDNFDVYICNSNVDNVEKKMKQMTTMIGVYERDPMSVDTAINTIKHIVHERGDDKQDVEYVNTKDAYGRITATDVSSSVKVPPYNSSTKHGYAVLASDGKGIRKVLKAHSTFSEISIISGTCVRVRSGEPIPNGATAVVTSANVKIKEESNDNNEDYFNIDDKEYEIEVLVAPEMYENIRHAGCEVEDNQLILKTFDRIGSAVLGILTLCGIDSILVIKRPSVGLLSIGDKLEEPGNTLTSGHIYDSNRIVLTSFLKENGYDAMDFGISAYKSDVIFDKIKNTLNQVDVFVTIGHANNKDILKHILKKHFNAVIHFGYLNMKPGKSTMLATCMFNDTMKFFLCMSSNPATVPIVAHVILLPLLNVMHYNRYTAPIVTAYIQNQELHPRPQYLWTTLRWTKKENFPRAFGSNNQQNVMKYHVSNALLMLPLRTPETTKIDMGFVQSMLFR